MSKASHLNHDNSTNSSSAAAAAGESGSSSMDAKSERTFKSLDEAIQAANETYTAVVDDNGSLHKLCFPKATSIKKYQAMLSCYNAVKKSCLDFVNPLNAFMQANPQFDEKNFNTADEKYRLTSEKIGDILFTGKTEYFHWMLLLFSSARPALRKEIAKMTTEENLAELMQTCDEGQEQSNRWYSAIPDDHTRMVWKGNTAVSINVKEVQLAEVKNVRLKIDVLYAKLKKSMPGNRDNKSSAETANTSSANGSESAAAASVAVADKKDGITAAQPTDQKIEVTIAATTTIAVPASAAAQGMHKRKSPATELTTDPKTASHGISAGDSAAATATATAITSDTATDSGASPKLKKLKIDKTEKKDDSTLAQHSDLKAAVTATLSETLAKTIPEPSIAAPQASATITDLKSHGSSEVPPPAPLHLDFSESDETFMPLLSPNTAAALAKIAPATATTTTGIDPDPDSPSARLTLSPVNCTAPGGAAGAAANIYHSGNAAALFQLPAATNQAAAAAPVATTSQFQK